MQKRGAFNLHVLREDIHRMIFQCCNYDRASAKTLFFRLEPAREDGAGDEPEEGDQEARDDPN